MASLAKLHHAMGHDRTAIIDPKEMQPGDVADTFADINAIARDHGYAPTTSIDEGVPRFVKWYHDYHAG